MRRNPTGRCLALAITTFAVASCGGGGEDLSPDAATPDATPRVDAALEDPTAVLFRPDHVLEVVVTLAPADWATLRAQPEQIGLPEVTCANPAAADAYTYFAATLEIDGTTIADVGVRKKGGFGSLSTERPGLKIKADKFVAGQTVFGLERLTLNNNHQDPTLVSQCLGYGLYAAAGLPASRCSFAHVTVNGEDLGIYSNVESIDRDFLERRFDDASGNLYESGGEFVAGGTGGFQPKTNSEDPDCSDLEPVVEALAAPAGQLEAELGAVVDLPQFTRYWAMEVLTDHWDGYANNQNNYWFYRDPSAGGAQGKFVFLPSGIDALFEGRERTTRPQSVFACGALAWHLYDVAGTRAAYLAALRDLLEDVWDEPALLAELDRMQALLEPYADPGGTGALGEQIDRVRAFVTTRADELFAELDAGEPTWPYPLAESCRPRIGTVTGTFAGTWGTLGEFGLGDGTLVGDVAGIDLTSSDVFVGAGPEEAGKPMLQLFGELADGRYAVAYVVYQTPAAYQVGTAAIDLANVSMYVVIYDPATETTEGGWLVLGGSITLDEAGLDDGLPVTGSFTGDVLEL
jgi:hypothetical protein